MRWRALKTVSVSLALIVSATLAATAHAGVWGGAWNWTSPDYATAGTFDLHRKGRAVDGNFDRTDGAVGTLKGQLNHTRKVWRGKYT